MADGNSVRKATPENPKYQGAKIKEKDGNFMVKYYHEKEKANKITVNLKGDVQKYALSFLHIWNNAREYPEMFYKVENDSGNYIYITCRKKDTETITEYLEQFGEIIDTEEINYFTIKAEYDFKGWNELFDDDCEVEFTVEID